MIRGERRLAFQYAADEKLWAHAMVIASSVDRDAWKEVVKEFVQTELSGNVVSHDTKSGRAPLRVAYSLFSGEGAASGSVFLLVQFTVLTLLSPSESAGTAEVAHRQYVRSASASPSPRLCHASDAELSACLCSANSVGSSVKMGRDGSDDRLESNDC